MVEIDDKAFLRCRSLRSIRLNAGLQTIGDDAFSGSALESLHVPKTVCHIGRSIAEHTNVRFSGDDATFSVNRKNRAYFVNGEGCLYRRGDDGVHLAQMLDPEATRCHIEPGTVGIDEKACAYHAALETVEIPQGVKCIGDGAFRVCRKLRRVSVPDTLESVGTEAFIDTALERFRVPVALVDIGPRAFVTDGAHHEGPLPALREIDVDAGNARFFMHDGMLCRRHERYASVVMFTSACANVSIPDDVEDVEDYAFNNAFGIEELRLNARLRTIGACGLSVMSQIRHVRIDVAPPVEGRSSFDLRFPATTRSVHGFLLALGGMGYLYLPDIMAQYDSCIASSRNYRAPRDSDNASAYEQSKIIVARLRDATLLTESNLKRYRVLFEENLEEICVDIARHDDRAMLGSLMDLGLLNEGNIERVIAAVARLQDAAMTAYLLEAKRLRFGCDALDFDL